MIIKKIKIFISKEAKKNYNKNNHSYNGTIANIKETSVIRRPSSGNKKKAKNVIKI